MNFNMNKNKIINIAYKKLLRNNFQHSEIKEFLDKNTKYENIENFLQYIVKLSYKSYHNESIEMAIVLREYAEKNLNNINTNIILSKDNLIKNISLLTNDELALIHGWNATNKNSITFDFEDDCFLNIHDLKNYEYLDFMAINYQEIKGNWFNSKINQKINQCYGENRIYLFTKIQDKNLFIGKYEFQKNIRFIIDDFNIPGFLIKKEGTDSDDVDLLIKKFDVYNFKKIKSSFKLLKSRLYTEILKYENDSDKLDELFSLFNDHLPFLTTLIKKTIKEYNLNLYYFINDKYHLMIKEINKINYSLTENYSILNKFEMLILTNSYNFLISNKVFSNFENDLFLITDKKIEKDNFKIKGYKSYNNHFFDLDLNKKIFNTTKVENLITVFKRIDIDKYLFLGFYIVNNMNLIKDKSKSYLEYDLKKINHNLFTKYIINSSKKSINNSYQQIFNNLIEKNELLSQFGSIYNKRIREIKKISLKTKGINYQINSYIKKMQRDVDKKNINEYWSKDFLKIVNEIDTNFEIIKNFNVEEIIKNNLLDMDVIATQFLKNNIYDEELKKITYLDINFTQNKKEKILNLINKNNKV